MEAHTEMQPRWCSKSNTSTANVTATTAAATTPIATATAAATATATAAAASTTTTNIASAHPRPTRRRCPSDPPGHQPATPEEQRSRESSAYPARCVAAYLGVVSGR